MIRAVAPLFFLSGAVALGCETVYFRWLGLLFGAAHEATGVLLAAFMGGLALGSELGARTADRARAPLRLYALAEAIVGAYALASVAFFPRLEALAATSSVALRLALAFALLALPTVAMGATLPLLAAAIVPSRAALREGVARLYTVNLAGGVAGALVTGFVLLPRVGLHASTRVLGGVALAVALSAALVAARVRPDAPRASAPPSWGFEDPLAPWIAGAVGTLSFALQVAWNRVFSLLLGSSAYTFALVVAVILASTALGGAASQADEEGDVARAEEVDAAFWKKVTRRLLAIAIAIYLGTLVVYVAPFHLTWAAAHASTVSVSAARVGLVVVIVAVPSYHVGALFPALASRFPTRGVGRTAGRAVLVSTLGNIAGALGAAFMAIPLAGVERTLAIGSAVALLPALAAARRAGPAPFRGMILASAMACAFAAALRPGWDAVGLSAGSYRLGLYREKARAVTDACGPLRKFTENRVLFFRDGPVGTVAVLGHDGGPECALYSLRVNGKAEGSVFAREKLRARVAPMSELLPIGDLPSEVLAGILPAIAGAKPARAFLVGWGTGVSTRALLVGGAAHVDAVEIEPAVVEAGALFDADVQRDPRVAIVIDDARLALRRAPPGAFDVIVSHPSNPWVTGASALFSREYFARVRSRLVPGGRALAWIQLYEIDREAVRSLLATFLAVFPDAHAFRATPTSRDVFLLGLNTDAPTSRDVLLHAIAQRAAEPAVAAALRRAGLADGPDGALTTGTYIGGGDRLARYAAGAPIETDERAALEFRVADHVLRGTGEGADELLRGLE